jgi:DNA repair protein RadB
MKICMVVVITKSGIHRYSFRTLRPVGGNIVEHISKTIIQLERLGDGKRRAVVRKHRSLPEGISCEFTITSEGVE